MSKESSQAEQLNPPPEKFIPEKHLNIPEATPDGVDKNVSPDDERTKDFLSIDWEAVGATKQTQEIAGEMKPESRNFFGKLYEKVKSSDVVQNVVDRYKVWKNDRLSQRAETKQSDLEKQGMQASERGQDCVVRKAKIDELIKKGQEALKASGVTLDKKSLIGAEKDKDQLTKEQGRNLKVQEAAMVKIDQVKEDLDNYTKEAEDARGRLDGRLEAKMAANDKVIEQYTKGKGGAEVMGLDGIKGHTDENNGKIAKIDGSVKKLQELLGEGAGKSVQRGFERALKELQGKKKELEAINKNLEAAQTKVQAKIDKLSGKNEDWQAKRDLISPPKEKMGDVASKDQPEVAKEALEQPTGHSIDATGEITLEFRDGRTEVLSGNKIIRTEADGRYHVSYIDNADDEELKKFMVAPPGELSKYKVPAKIIKRMESIASPAREKEQEDKKRFSAGDLVAAWNAKMPKQSGYRVALERGMNAQMKLESKARAKEFLLSLLAKKMAGGKVGKLDARLVGQVDKFFAERR